MFDTHTPIYQIYSVRVCTVPSRFDHKTETDTYTPTTRVICHRHSLACAVTQSCAVSITSLQSCVQYCERYIVPLTDNTMLRIFKQPCSAAANTHTHTHTLLGVSEFTYDSVFPITRILHLFDSGDMPRNRHARAQFGPRVPPCARPIMTSNAECSILKYQTCELCRSVIDQCEY